MFSIAILVDTDQNSLYSLELSGVKFPCWKIDFWHAYC